MKNLLGVRIGAGELNSLTDNAMRAVATRQSRFTFACANPHSLVIAHSDVGFRAALQACSAVVADGVGVALAARLVNYDAGPRITGADFFLAMMEQLNQRGGRVFFLGSTPGVLLSIATRARRDYPNLTIDGFSPPYGTWDARTNRELVERVREGQPDILWVGMTAPKQELWVHANGEQLNVPVIGSIGAVFDFYAGTVRRAPTWVCRIGLEWLYRLAREPRRLWRRTLLSAPAFLWLVLRRHVL